jgi:hypothetical protein
MTDLIQFYPILGYFLFASLMFIFRKFIFSLHASVLVAALLGNIAISVFTGGNPIIMSLQVFFAIVAFVLMVPFFAGKASGETMLAFTALIGLAPLSHDFSFGLVGALISLGLFFVFAVYKSKDKISQMATMATANNFKEETNGQEQENDSDNENPVSHNNDSPGTVKDMLTVGVLSTYNGQFKLPDYSYLPDGSTVKKEERVSFSTFALTGFALVALFNILYPILFLDS